MKWSVPERGLPKLGKTPGHCNGAAVPDPQLGGRRRQGMTFHPYMAGSASGTARAGLRPGRAPASLLCRSSSKMSAYWLSQYVRHGAWRHTAGRAWPLRWVESQKCDPSLCIEAREGQVVLVRCAGHRGSTSCNSTRLSLLILLRTESLSYHGPASLLLTPSPGRRILHVVLEAWPVT
jgi:hypothetical protein